MPSSNETNVNIKTTSILKVVGVFVGLWVLWMIRDILALLFVALFLAALLHPAATWGARHKIPKGITVIVIYLLIFGIAVTSFVLLLPALVEQLGNLTNQIGTPIRALTDGFQSLKDLSAQFGLSSNLSSSITSVFGQISQAADRGFELLKDVFGGIAGLIIALVMAFYMVVQDKEAIRLFRNLVPESYQQIGADLLVLVEEKIGRWLYGQLFLMLFVGVMYYIGLLVLGIPNPLPLALFGAFTEFIPYLGPMLAGIPIVIVAFSVSPFKALLCIGLMIFIQQLESQIVVPKVMQKAVGLNPLASIVAVLVGAKLFGVVGALLSIPIATAISVALTELYRYRQEKS